MSERENRTRCRSLLCKLSDLLRRNTSAEVEIIWQLSDHDVIAVEYDSNFLKTGSWSNKVIGATTTNKAMDRGFASVNLLA
jgi:hypothetical protein